jgi:competence protein ComEC
MVRRLSSWLARQVGPGPLDDPAALVLALAATLGALVAAPVPVVPAFGLAGLALVLRRPCAVWVAAAVLASALAAQAWGGLVPPTPGLYSARVVLATDPSLRFGAWSAEVVDGDRRLEVVARGGAGAALGERSAGEWVRVSGRLEALDGAPWLTVRHVVGRLVVDEVQDWGAGGVVAQASNAVRSLLARGAASLPDDQRALFMGFVLGDDRGQDPAQAGDFEAAGLTHLLVVSGANVAFLLVVVGPLLRRLPLTGRFLATAAVLVFFAALTRFEPSVLRATVMAGLAALGVALGRPGGGVRMLALAVAALVLFDPFLVHAVGFRLSVAASAGILVLARPLAAALPGPRVAADALAVTLAAQAGVAPVLVPAFGPMPLAAVPANVLAEPVAGLVMMWGCSAGLVAGLAGGVVADVVHLPTSWGLGWVAGVARWAASLPLGSVGLPGVAAVGAGLASVVVGRRSARPALWAVGSIVAVAVVVAPALRGSSADPEAAGAAQGGAVAAVDLGGAELWRTSGAAVLVLGGDASGATVLGRLREAGVSRLDLVVVRSTGPGAAATLDVVDDRVDVGAVWAPEGHRIEGAAVPAAGTVEGAGLRISIRRTARALEVTVAASK